MEESTHKNITEGMGENETHKHYLQQGPDKQIHQESSPENIK